MVREAEELASEHEAGLLVRRPGGVLVCLALSLS